MWFRRRPSRPQLPPATRDPHDRPDVEKARADLARIKTQRPDVEALVTALVLEQHLNNFSANLTATFRGGRA